MTPHEGPPLSWPAAARRVALYLTAVVVAQIALGAAFYGMAMLYFMKFRGMAPGQALTQPGSLGTETMLQIFSTLPALLLVLWITRLFCRRLDRRTLSSLGLHSPRLGWPLTVTLGLGTGFLAVAIMVALAWLGGGYRFTGLSTSWATWWMLPTLLGAAFMEELIMRGYVLQKFQAAGSLPVAVAVSSACFWLFHGLNPAAWSSPWVSVNLFGAGVVLALAYLASGDLWFPTLIHFAWNTTQGVLLELPISGIQTDGIVDLELTGGLPSWLTGGAFGFEGSVLATGSEALMALLLLYLWRRRTGGKPDDREAAKAISQKEGLEPSP